VSDTTYKYRGGFSVRKIADETNYGDQPSVDNTITPSAFGRRAIPDIDLYRARPREELKQLFFCAGFNLTDYQFDELFNIAAKCDPSGCGQVSVESFRSALACHCCIRKDKDGKSRYECCLDIPSTAAICPAQPQPPSQVLSVCKPDDTVALRNKRAVTDLVISGAKKDDHCQTGVLKNKGLEEPCPFKTHRLPNISPYVIHGIM